MNKNFERTQAIVEDLRADIDFELDDVIAKIVHGLPDDYFVSLSAADQLKPLKALLAMGICHLDDEIMMRSEDGQKIVVAANTNYPGQLADLLHRLPHQHTLIGAKIFTSTDHDFIIDVFDFEQDHEGQEPTPSVPLGLLAEEVAELANQPIEVIAEFVSHYHPLSPILSSARQVAEQFMAYIEIEQPNDTAIRWTETENSELTRITVSAGSPTARQLLQCTSELLGKQNLDIEQAWLHDIPLDLSANSHVAVVSFLVGGAIPSQATAFKKYLDENLL